MPSDIRIVGAHEFIQVTPDGLLDLERTKKVLLEIAYSSASLPDYDVVLDIRNADIDMDVTDLWELASELHKYGAAFSRKTAVLVPQERSDYGGFFALCAQERGFEVSAFTHFGDAMEWLNGT
jgi:hypothetical protein